MTVMGKDDQRAAPMLSVVVVVDGRGDIEATLDALARNGISDAEVVPAVNWPVPREATSARNLPGVACAAGVGDAAAFNTGLARARGRRVLLLRAGDRVDPGVLRAHAHGSPDEVLVGLVLTDDDAADPIGDGWTGVRPRLGPARAARHLSADRQTLLSAGGLDDRVHDLDVAALDLAARLRDSDLDVHTRRDLVIREAARPRAELRRAAVRAGQAAHVVAVLDLQRGHPATPFSVRFERLALAWLEPAVLAASGLTFHAVGPLERTALRCAFARGRGLPVLPTLGRDRLGPPAAAGPREPVAVVVPFAGSREEGAELLSALAHLQRRENDELVVVDNSREAVLEARPGIDVVRADVEWSSYHARNVGWRRTHAPWVLFLDADCRPVPWLLDAFFAPPPPQDAGAVAGNVIDAPGRALAERYSRAVGVLRQSAFLDQEPRGFAATANLLVRRSALVEIDGFMEGIRSSGDADASHRLQDAGWKIAYRPRAAVVHLHRTTLAGVVRQYCRYAAGVAWLRTRHEDVAGEWPPHPVQTLRSVPGDLVAARLGLAILHSITAWTMWRARGTDVADNVAERPGNPAPERSAAPAGSG